MASTARYRVIADDLTAKILAGEYAPGQPLPAQRDLSTAYGVTLMTLRQALRELSDDGLIVQRPGRGTFVTPAPVPYRLGSLRSFADDLRDQGYEVRTHVVSRALRRLPAHVATLLHRRPTDHGLRVERVREFAGRRAVHQVSWVRQPDADRIRDVDFTATSLYTALTTAGAIPTRATETIRAGLLDPAAAAHLDEPEGSPVLVSERVTLTQDGAPTVVDRAVILGEIMQISTDRAADGLSLRWTTP